MTSQIIPISNNRTDDPRIKDVDLAVLIGYVRPRIIRTLIARHQTRLKKYGEIPMERDPLRSLNGPASIVFWLNLKQAVYLSAMAKTEDPKALARQLRAAFEAPGSDAPLAVPSPSAAAAEAPVAMSAEAPLPVPLVDDVIRVDGLPDITPISYGGLPVMTTELLASAYGVAPRIIRDGYYRNTARFTLGKHFFELEGEELQTLKNCNVLSVAVDKHARNLLLWTKRGAARHAKMVRTDQAWDVFETLEEAYFNPPVARSPEPETNRSAPPPSAASQSAQTKKPPFPVIREAQLTVLGFPDHWMKIEALVPAPVGLRMLTVYGDLMLTDQASSTH